MSTEFTPVGSIMEVPLPNRMVRFAKVVRLASDAVEWKSCSVCHVPFGYGPIGKHMVTGALVCLTPCVPSRNRPE